MLLQRQALFSSKTHQRVAPRLPCQRLICRAQKDEDNECSASQTIKGVAAAALAASFIFASAGAGPAEAARSGGRAGGSSFRSAAPRASAPRSSNGPSVTNKTYNYSVNPSPPIGGGFGGFGGFGMPFGGYGYGGGISFFPTFVTPIGGGIGGGIFQLFFVAIIASTLFGAIRAVFGSRRRNDYDD